MIVMMMVVMMMMVMMMMMMTMFFAYRPRPIRTTPPTYRRSVPVSTKPASMECQATRAEAWSAAADEQARAERVGRSLALAAMSPPQDEAVVIAAPGDARPRISSPTIEREVPPQMAGTTSSTPRDPPSADGIAVAASSREVSLGRLCLPHLLPTLGFIAAASAADWGHMLGPPRSCAMSC
jgi:hypothetical protein